MLRPSLALTFTLLLPAAVSADPVQVRRAEVAAPPSSAAAAATGTLGAKEQGILKKLGTMTPGQISELLEAYSRMGNHRMAAALSQALLKREPANKQYRALTASLLKDAAAAPENPIAQQATQLIQQNQPAAAASLLTNLKTSKYPGVIFPWQDDLAYALHDAGKAAEAKAAFEEILRLPGYPAPSREEARKALNQLLIESLAKAGDSALKQKESAHALQLAEQLLAISPGDPDAVALKANAYTAAGQPRRAVDYLLSLKTGTTGAFPHQLTLASAYQDARMFGDARAAYQAIISDPAALPALQAEARQHLADLDRDARITAGSHALRTGQIAKAELILTELESTAPGAPETTSFKASLQLKRRQYASARDTLKQLRTRAESRQEFFDARDNLAESLAGTGAAREAAGEYAKVKDDARYDTLTRYEAARRSSDLNQRLAPAFAQLIEGTHEAEGTRFSATSEISTGEIAESGNVFLLRSAWDSVELDENRLVRIKETERYQIEGVWRHNLQQGFYGELSAGASQRDFLYGAAIGRAPQPGATAWELSFNANERALDTLPLVALDGRQNQIALTVQRDLTDRFSVDGSVRYRWVDLKNRELGEGLNVNFNATYTLITESPTRPELSLSYQGEIQRFARKTCDPGWCDQFLRSVLRGQRVDLASDLIEEHINRHGFILTLSKKFSPHLSACIYGGFAREFQNAQNEGLAGAGLEAFVGPRTVLFLNADYTTSGRAGSRGAEAWSASAGAKVSF